MGVPPKIFNGISKSVESFFDIRAPVLFIKFIFPFFPVIAVLQFTA